MAGRTALTRPKEISYIEDELRLPELWRQHDMAYEELMALLGRKSVQLAAVDNLNGKLAESEREIKLKLIVEENWATLSVAAQDRLTKEAILKDDAHQQLGERWREAKAQLEQIDNDLEGIKLGHRTLTTRINSIAELIGFLRSARDARTAAEMATPY